MPNAVYFMSLLIVMTFLITILMALVPDVLGKFRELLSKEDVK